MIRKRGSRYQVVVQIPGTDPVTGKRNGQLTDTVDTYAEAKEVERGFHSQIHQKKVGTRATLQQVFDEWWAEGRSNIAGSTADTYESRIRLHVLPHRLEPNGKTLGETPLTDIGPRVYQRFQNQLVKKGLKPWTVKGVRTALSAVMAWSVAMEYRLDNPIAKVDPPPLNDDPDERPAPSLEECALVLLWLEENDSDFLDYVYTFFDLVARRGETLALRWRHLTEEGEAIVQRAITRDADGRMFDAPVNKNKKRKNGALTDYTVRRLAARRRRVEERLSRAAGKPTLVEPDDYVFAQDRSFGKRPWHPSRASQRFARARDGAGIDPQHDLYGIRRTILTELGRLGVDPKTIQELAGQSSDRIMLHYQRTTKALKKDAIDKLGAKLQQAVEKERRKAAPAVQLSFLEDSG